MWGAAVSLGDCDCRQLSIGNLHFQAGEYGDILQLNASTLRRRGAIEREERNQCALLGVSSGLVDRDAIPMDLPTRSRAA